MANINLHWFEEISERLNIDIDLPLALLLVQSFRFHLLFIKTETFMLP